MRSQLHALAALLSTKERPVLIECEVRSPTSQDVVEGNILMLSRIERRFLCIYWMRGALPNSQDVVEGNILMLSRIEWRFLGRQTNNPSIPTTLDVRLGELVFETMKRKIVTGRNCVRSTYVVEMEERRTADCQFCHLSTTFPNNNSRYAVTLLRPTDAACPLLVCSDFITVFQWCLCVSSFDGQFCQYVTTIDHLFLLLSPPPPPPPPPFFLPPPNI